MTEFFVEPAVSVTADGPVAATLRAPSSKSLSNRVLLIAALADGTSELSSVLLSQDTEAMLRAIEAFGATAEGFAPGPEDFRITGTGGRISARRAEVDAGLSGTTLRFALAVAALSDEIITLSGEPPLLRRPLGELATALRHLGALVIDQDGFAPVAVRGPLTGGEVTVDVSGSSQFLSAVLLAAPYATRDVVATAVGQSADAYIEMTADVMRRWGASVTSLSPGTWHVAAGETYIARNESVEYDASAAAHLFTLAAASGGTVTVTNAAPGTLQPDAGVVGVLTAMGCTVEQEDTTVTVRGPDRLLAVDVDLAAMPDQLPTVAVLAALAEGTTRITGAAVTRGHETDRIAAMATELHKLGVKVEEHADGLTVTGGARGPARLSTYNDHRLAMAFAALALAVGDVVIEDPGCVAKTYPGFWTDLTTAGAVVRGVP